MLTITSNRFSLLSRRLLHLSSNCLKKDLDEYGEGFTRSIYCKPKIIEHIDENGYKRKIYSALVDNTKEHLGDQWKRLLLDITYKSDFSLPSIRRRLIERIQAKNKARQIISTNKLEKLGPDLAVAHMICSIGGRVQFEGSDHWYQQIQDSPADLPLSAGNVKLQTLDASGTNITYEGFEHISLLSGLRILRLRRCANVDDVCLSRVSRVTSIELLDISDCPAITSNGVATLALLKNLRYLALQDNPFLQDRELVSLLLEECLPQLYVQGVDYVAQLPLESRERILALAAPNEDEYAEAESSTTSVSETGNCDDEIFQTEKLLKHN